MRWRLLLAAVVILGLVVPPVRAQTRTADESVDVALGALEEPLRPWRPVVGTLVPGAPVWPPYKQEPPAAQRDFRVLGGPTAPPPSVGVPPAAPDTTKPPKPAPAPPSPPPAAPPKPCPKPPKPCV